MKKTPTTLIALAISAVASVASVALAATPGVAPVPSKVAIPARVNPTALPPVPLITLADVQAAQRQAAAARLLKLPPPAAAVPTALTVTPGTLTASASGVTGALVLTAPAAVFGFVSGPAYAWLGTQSAVTIDYTGLTVGATYVIKCAVSGAGSTSVTVFAGEAYTYPVMGGTATWLSSTQGPANLDGTDFEYVFQIPSAPLNVPMGYSVPGNAEVTFSAQGITGTPVFTGCTLAVVPGL